MSSLASARRTRPSKRAPSEMASDWCMMSPSTSEVPESVTADGPNGPAHGTVHLDLLGADHALDGSAGGDGHLLAVDVAADVAVHAQLVLRDDGDLLAEKREIPADHRCSGLSLERGCRHRPCARGIGLGLLGSWFYAGTEHVTAPDAEYINQSQHAQFPRQEFV